MLFVHASGPIRAGSEKGDLYCGITGNSIFVHRIKDKDTMIANDCCEYKKSAGTPETTTMER